MIKPPLEAAPGAPVAVVAAVVAHHHAPGRCPWLHLQQVSHQPLRRLHHHQLIHLRVAGTHATPQTSRALEQESSIIPRLTLMSNTILVAWFSASKRLTKIQAMNFCIDHTSVFSIIIGRHRSTWRTERGLKKYMKAIIKEGYSLQLTKEEACEHDALEFLDILSGH